MKPEHLNKKKREALIRCFRTALSKPNSFSGIPQDNESWTEVTRCRYWAVFDVSPSPPFPKVIHECTKHMYSFMLQGEFNWCLLLLGDQNISLSLFFFQIPFLPLVLPTAKEGVDVDERQLLVAKSWSQVVSLDSRWHSHVCQYALCR